MGTHFVEHNTSYGKPPTPIHCKENIAIKIAPILHEKLIFHQNCTIKFAENFIKINNKVYHVFQQKCFIRSAFNVCQTNLLHVYFSITVMFMLGFE